MTTTIRTELQKRAQSTLVQYAVFRWESAMVLAVTLVLLFLLPRPFFWWPRFGWLWVGLLGLIVIVYSSLTDVDANARVLLQLFQEQFDSRKIKDKDLRDKVVSALEYQRRIETQVRDHPSGVLRDKLEDVAGQMTDWLSNIYQLAVRLDAFRSDDLLARERAYIPKEIEQLTAQRKLERNPGVQSELDEALVSKGKQWQTLRDLDARMKEAALRLDQSLTALATVYSQIHLIDAQSIRSGGAERLQADMQEQVARLNDLISSISNVYDYHTKGLN